MSPIERLQDDIAKVLAADAFFATVPVFLIRPRRDSSGQPITMPMLQEQIDQALGGIAGQGGKSGVAVSVLMPTILCEKPNVPGPELRAVAGVWCQERTVINSDPVNGTGISAEDLGLRVVKLLHLRVFQPLGVLSAEREAMTPAVDKDSDLVTYQVKLSCRLAVTPLSKVSAPSITNAGGTITLACATAGASIYYSTDDSLPAHGGTIGGAGASGSTLYTVPFTPGSGAGIRAAAYKTGLAGSDATYLLLP